MNITVTPDYLRNWISTAKPGWQMVYHVGHLAYDRERIIKGKSCVVEPLATVAQIAYAAYEMGYCELTQVRVSENRFTYLLTKRAHNRRMP